MMKNLILTIMMISITLLSSSQDCKNVIVKIDKFTGDTTISTPISYRATTVSDISFIAIKTTQFSIVSLNLSTIGSTLNIATKGANILFSDGTYLDFPNTEIKVRVDNWGRYSYSTVISLSTEEIELLKTKLITDFRLYIYDAKIKEKDAIIYQRYFNCLLNKM